MGFCCKSNVLIRRRIAACVAIVVLLFATSAGFWHHHDSNSSATCQVCHVVNQPLQQAQVRAELPRPVAFVWTVLVQELNPALDPITRHASPRAPPA